MKALAVFQYTEIYLQNSVNVDFVRVGNANESGVGESGLQRGHRTLHGGVLRAGASTYRSGCFARSTHQRQDPQRIQNLFLRLAILGEVNHTLRSAWSLMSAGFKPLRASGLHNIGSALTTAALDSLELASQLGGQDFEHPSIGVLVDKRPVEVKDDKLFAGHYEMGIA